MIALNPKPAVQKFWFDSVPFGQEYINKTQTLSEEMRNVNGTAEFSDLLRGLDATYLEAVSYFLSFFRWGKLTFPVISVFAKTFPARILGLGNIEPWLSANFRTYPSVYGISRHLRGPSDQPQGWE